MDLPKSLSERYNVAGALGTGGQAQVLLGRQRSQDGFARTVAIKRLHPYLAADATARAMFVDEARITSRIHHPGVVPIADVVVDEDDVFLVMDYIEGESLARLLRMASDRSSACPARVAVAIMAGVLRGLHAAHEAKREDGTPLGIVHRDLSPHNIMVGTDGFGRLLDFGIAKAMGKASKTQTGELKGKFGYFAPEQLSSKEDAIGRGVDIFAAGICLWEALTGKRLFAGEPGEVCTAILTHRPTPPSAFARGIPRALDEVVMRALARNPRGRYATAREMAEAVEHSLTQASPAEVGAWVEDLAGTTLASRRSAVMRLASIDDTVRVVPAGGDVATDASAIATATTTLVDRPRTQGLRFLGVVLVTALVGFVALRFATAAPRLTQPERHSITPVGPKMIVLSSANERADKVDRVEERLSTPPVASGKRRARATPACSPFYLDASGHKIYRAECVE